jgi:hypothetical protein
MSENLAVLSSCDIMLGTDRQERRLWVLRLSSLRSLPTGDYGDGVLEGFLREKSYAGPVSERSRKLHHVAHLLDFSLPPCPPTLAPPLNLQTFLRGCRLQPEILSMTLYRQALSLISVQKLLLMSAYRDHITERETCYGVTVCSECPSSRYRQWSWNGSNTRDGSG